VGAREDVAFRVLAGGLCPDHVTIARFRVRHQTALANVLVDSLRLCAEAGLVKLGVVALDGTKMAANASAERNRTLAALNKQIKDMIAEAEQLDAAETQAAGEPQTGLPAGLGDPVTRRRRPREAQQRLQEAKARLEATVATRQQGFQARCDQVNQARAAKGLPRRQLKPRARDEAPQRDATTNLTDPDSRVLIGRHGRVQGYNAQLMTTAEQIILAAEVTQAANDVDQLAPMLTATAPAWLRPGSATRYKRWSRTPAAGGPATWTDRSRTCRSCMWWWPSTPGAGRTARMASRPRTRPGTWSKR
jgi:hypothetical protein